MSRGEGLVVIAAGPVPCWRAAGRDGEAVKRPASVRAAVAKSREARLRAMERNILATLRYLRRRDPDGHAAL
jgi:hypothetical protein